MSDDTIRTVLAEAQRLSADPNSVRAARREWLLLRSENQRLRKLVRAMSVACEQARAALEENARSDE